MHKSRVGPFEVRLAELTRQNFKGSKTTGSTSVAAQMNKLQNLKKKPLPVFLEWDVVDVFSNLPTCTDN